MKKRNFSMNQKSKTIKEQLQNKINMKTKPIGSLGALEDMAMKIGTIQNTLTPQLNNPAIIVFAGDHGIADAGVSPFPKEVTRQMVYNFLSGGAAINVFCKQNNISLKVADAGVDHDFENNDALIIRKVAKGTKNIIHENAMNLEQCREAMTHGADLVNDEYKSGCNTIGFGEMGIGNTSSAALLMSKFCGIPVDICAGRGTGHDDAGLEKKISLLKEVIENRKVGSDPEEILAALGGFEIAMMTGAMLKAAQLNMVVLVDGFIATAAILAASSMNNEVLNNCIFCHQSEEQGHRLMLEFLKVKPLLKLGMRLGEGTGAAVALPVLQSAVNFLAEMASFEDAGVSNKE